MYARPRSSRRAHPLRALPAAPLSPQSPQSGAPSLVAGSNLTAEVVLVLAFSNLVADAIAMGVGDFISTKAENDHILAERKREGACM